VIQARNLAFTLVSQLLRDGLLQRVIAADITWPLTLDHREWNGHQAAIRKFRSALGAAVATAPLQRVELDHTVLDVMVLDDETLMPLGRPTLAIAIDAFTRCILGICIGFEPPCTSTVSQCLKSVFSPKERLLALVSDIENAWDCFGKIETLVLDQALENHALFLDRLALTQSIEILYCPRKTPWFKARIERFIGTLNSSVCHKIPGTTFSNIQQKGDYNPVCQAVCTMAGLKAAIIKWIVDIYHVRRHRVATSWYVQGTILSSMCRSARIHSNRMGSESLCSLYSTRDHDAEILPGMRQANKSASNWSHHVQL